MCRLMGMPLEAKQRKRIQLLLMQSILGTGPKICAQKLWNLHG